MYVNTSKIDGIIYIYIYISKIDEIIYIYVNTSKIHEIIYKYVNTLNVISIAYGNASNADTHERGMLLQKARIQLYRTHTEWLMAVREQWLLASLLA